jgi:hypothetical protein
MSTYSDTYSDRVRARHLYKFVSVLGRHARSSNAAWACVKQRTRGGCRRHQSKTPLSHHRLHVPQYISSCNTLFELIVKRSRIKLKETCERDMPTCGQADMRYSLLHFRAHSKYSTLFHTASPKTACRSTENLYDRAAVSRKRPVAVD